MSAKSILLSVYLIFFSLSTCLIFVLFSCKVETVRPNPSLLWVPVNKWYLGFYWPSWQYLLAMGFFGFSLSFHRAYSFAKDIVDSSVSQTKSSGFSCTSSAFFVLKKATTQFRMLFVLPLTCPRLFDRTNIICNFPLIFLIIKTI